MEGECRDGADPHADKAVMVLDGAERIAALVIHTDVLAH